MNSSFRDFLPLIAIVGPIAAALITLAATRYFRERKHLTFVIVRTEDLTLPLRRDRNLISFKIDDKEVKEFNRALVFVENTGNVAIKELSFVVRMVGLHNVRLFNMESENAALKENIQAEWDEYAFDDELRVSLPFLNPKESFRVALFFDGKPTDVEVLYRMEGVTPIFRRNSTITAFAPEALEALLNIYERIPGLSLLTGRFRKRLKQYKSKNPPK